MTKRKNPVIKFLSIAVTSGTWDIFKFIISAIGSIISIWIPWVDRIREVLSPWILYPSIGIMIYGITQIFTDIFNWLAANKLLLINVQRSKGVELKSKHYEIENEDQSIAWVKSFNKWDIETEKIIRRFDPAFAEYFKYINTYVLTTPNIKGFDNLQQRKINALVEKLARLENYYKEERAK